MQPVVSDLYDKLSAVPQNLAGEFQSQFDSLTAQIKALQSAASSAATTSATTVTLPTSGGSSVTVSSTVTVFTDVFVVRDINYPATSQATGSLYVTTDRQAVYYDNGLSWVLISGVAYGVDASKYADLGANDAGYVWYATDINTVWLWNGTSWLRITSQSVLTGTHYDRISYGNGNVAGVTLTATSGPSFQPYWVGTKIGIGGVLFTIATYISSTQITLTAAPTAGATTWYMSLFPVFNYTRGEIYIETDRQVLYNIGSGAGTCNLNNFLVTWVSGPFFSPYWIGQTITVNGNNYVVDSATLTSIGLHTSSGTVATGVSWSIPNSVWYYQVGVYHAGTVNKPTDLNPYSDLGFIWHDTTALVSYYGVKETAYSSSVLYFAWLDGLESMTYSAFTGRTFYPSDAGYTVNITDYAHTIIWNGSGWRFAPGDGSKYFQDSDGTPPNGGVWQLCDGTTVNVFIITAGVVSLLSFTTPDTTSSVFFRGGAYNGIVDPTSAPTFSSSGFTVSTETATHTHSFSAAPTSTESAGHTHGVTAIVMATENATHNHSIAGLGTSNELTNHTHTNATTANAQAGAGVVVPLTLSIESAFHGHTLIGTTATESATHAHALSGTTDGTSNTHTHLFTAASSTESATHSHTLTGTGSVGAPIVGAGAPRSIAFQRYLRR